MPGAMDLKSLSALPRFKIGGHSLDNFYDVKSYKGKFVVTKQGQLLIKIVPLPDYEKHRFYHTEILEEAGVKNAESPKVKSAIKGGGKIEVELIEGYLECRLFDKSDLYGRYDPKDIDQAGLELALDSTFGLGMMPILVIPDFKNN